MANLAPHPTPRPARPRAGSESRGRLKRRAIALGAGFVILLASALGLLLVDANLLRAPLARYLAARLDRPVAIDGDLRIVLRGGLGIEVNELVVGNAQWGSRPAMLSVERAAIRIRLSPLLTGRVVLPAVELVKPDVLLERNSEGVANWQFGGSSRPAGGVGAGPEVRSLSIQDGRLQFRDPLTRSDVVLQIESVRRDASVDDSSGPTAWQSDSSGVAGCARAISISKAAPVRCWS